MIGCATPEGKTPKEREKKGSLFCQLSVCLQLFGFIVVGMLRQVTVLSEQLTISEHLTRLMYGCCEVKRYSDRLLSDSLHAPHVRPPTPPYTYAS